MNNNNDWVDKVNHWELCQKLKFYQTNKWYIHNPESVLQNETHKLLWDFEIQTDHLISTSRPDLVIINKKRELAELWTLLFWLAAEGNWKKAKRKISTWTLLWNWKSCGESDGGTNCNWCSRYSHQRFSARTGGLEDKRTRYQTTESLK